MIFPGVVAGGYSQETVDIDLSARVLATAPYSYWRMNVASAATTVPDLGSAGVALNINGAAVRGIRGIYDSGEASISLPGVYTASLTPTSSTNYRHAGDFSFFIVGIIPTGATPFVECGAVGETAATNILHRITISNTGVSFFHEGGSGVNIGGDTGILHGLSAGDPFSFMITRDVAANTYALYSAGAFVDSAVYTTTPSGGTSASLYFGRYYDTTAILPVRFDEIGFWKRVLTGPEIASIVASSWAQPIEPLANINVAFDSILTPSGVVNTANPYSVVTDGIIVFATTGYVGQDPGLQNVVIDMGKLYNIDSVLVSHYVAASRSYLETKTEVSEDGVSWDTIFDSAVSGTYVELAAGQVHTFTKRPVRYIRDWVNGNTVNTGNHWTEIQAYRTT